MAGIDLQVAGVILMVVGAVGLVVGLALLFNSRTTAVVSPVDRGYRPPPEV